MKIAKDNSIKKSEVIIEEIKQIVCDWEQYANEVNVSPELKNSITKTLVALKF